MPRPLRFVPEGGVLARFACGPDGRSLTWRQAGVASCRIWHILSGMGEGDKPLVWLHGEIKTPPMSVYVRLEAGHLLRRLQQGELLSMPDSRPMPSIGPRCHELRIGDAGVTWRIFYRIDPDAIVILEVLKKKTATTPQTVLQVCRRRLAEYDQVS